MTAQRGSVLLWFALVLPLFIGVVGLATDAGYVYNQRQRLQDVADDAARTGAERLDERAYYERQVIAVDPAAARQAALAYLADVAPADTATVQADPQRVFVALREQVPLPFLRALGLPSADVTVRSSAAPRRNGG